MVVAGFYFTSIEDICVCFHCGTEIFEWESQDEPIDEHLKYSPDYNYAPVFQKFEDKIKKEIVENFFRKEPPIRIKSIWRMENIELVSSRLIFRF